MRELRCPECSRLAAALSNPEGGAVMAPAPQVSELSLQTQEAWALAQKHREGQAWPLYPKATVYQGRLGGGGWTSACWALLHQELLLKDKSIHSLLSQA